MIRRSEIILFRSSRLQTIQGATHPKNTCQSYVSCELRIRAVKLYSINNANDVAMCSEKHLDFTTFSTEYMLFC